MANDNQPRHEEAAIAIDALLMALERLMAEPDAKKVLSHLKTIDVIARQALEALRSAPPA